MKEENKKLLSVIVPVYNVENYLQKCVDSVLAQGFTDYEIILIDDGATDNSGTICDELAKRNESITVVHKPNGGLSSARNAGLKLAKGKYVYFLDSDDYLQQDMFSCLINQMEEGELDCIGFNANMIKPEGTKVYYDAQDIPENIVSGDEYLCRFIRKRGMIAAVCFYMYRLEILKDNSILFKEKIYSEDEHFTPRAVLCCKRVKFINRCFYNYFIRANSITSSNEKREKRYKDVVETLYELESFYKTKDIQEDCKKELCDYLARLYMGVTSHLKVWDKSFAIDKAFLKRNIHLGKTRLKKAVFTLSKKLFIALH